MKRVFFWAGAAVVAAIVAGGAAIIILGSFHQFAKVETAFAGRCSPVAGIAGPEDLQIDAATRTAFISSFDRREDAGRGAIYVFSLDDPLAEDAWRDRTRGAPTKFEPLGLHFYSDGEATRLFVVNAATNAVEIYDVSSDGELQHLRSVKERRLTSPNDVVAVGPDAFYVSNDVEPGRDSLLGQLHFLFRARSGKVLYFDGAAWRVAADGLQFANGVAVSQRSDRFYAAETAASRLRIYDRNPDTGVLTPSHFAPMPAAVDNINVDSTGALWIAAHPKPLMLPAYRRNPEGRAPSLVLRYADIDGPAGTPTTIYADSGEELSAATSAAALGSTMLVGALLEKKFLICQLPG